MPTITRREEQAIATQQSILRAASKLFSRNGFAKTSLDSIALEARMTKGALYHHFADKTDLYAACYGEQAGRVAEVIRDVPMTDDPWRDILAQCRAFLGCATMKSLRTVPIQEAITVLGWKRWRELDESRTMGLLVDSLERLRAEGMFRDHDPRLLLDAVYGMLVNAMVTLSMSKSKKKSPDELMTLIESFLRGAA